MAVESIQRKELCKPRRCIVVIRFPGSLQSDTVSFTSDSEKNATLSFYAELLNELNVAKEEPAITVQHISNGPGKERLTANSKIRSSALV
jgi:hypothetical protein